MAATQPSPHFSSLDALRGACASVIFFSHWVFWANFTPAPGVESLARKVLLGCTSLLERLTWPTGGNHPAVIAFFVLSGFCIHVAHVKRGSEGITPRWRDFYRRRFFRIMPVYWVAALLGLVLVAAEIQRPTHDVLLALNTESTPLHAAIRLLAATDLYPFEVLAGNGPLNTVGVELLLYAAYPLFHAQAVRGRWLLLGLVFLALEIAGLLLLPVLSPFWVYNSVFMFGIFWYAGAWVAHHVCAHGTRSYLPHLVVTWALFLVLNGVPHFYGLSVLKQNVWGLVCVFGVMQLLHLERSCPGKLLAAPWRLLKSVGHASYSLYAVHTPVLLLTTWALIHGGVRSYAVQLPVTLAAALGATTLVYFGVERVFYRPRTGVVVSRTVTETATVQVEV